MRVPARRIHRGIAQFAAALADVGWQADVGNARIDRETKVGALFPEPVRRHLRVRLQLLLALAQSRRAVIQSVVLFLLIAVNCRIKTCRKRAESQGQADRHGDDAGCLRVRSASTLRTAFSLMLTSTTSG